MANITQKSDVTFDSQTINFTGVDLHILNAALHSYVYGGYKGDNMNHLDAAEKLYDEISNIYSTSVNSK